MLDCNLFGLNPGMHHFINLLIHVINGLLLFIFLSEVTGSARKSMLVAAFFALHPINVDSVAWIAERKNVLSSLFWMLTMLAYARFIKQPSIKKYWVILVFFILGNMAKPILVTLPFVLLLLDFWPLGRLNFTDATEKTGPRFLLFFRNLMKLLFEKIPLFVVSFLSVFIASWSLQKLGHLVSTETVPMKLRIANAFVSYLKYIGKAIWPYNFSIHYPYPTEMYPTWQLVCSACLLLSISIYALSMIREKPYLITGWLWFIGTFVPAIGLKFSGTWGAINDRFAYIPFIGLFIVITWGVFDLPKTNSKQKFLVTVLSATIIIILSANTRTQVKHWKNSITLFEHALKVTENNYFVHNLLGAAMGKQGRVEAAIVHFKESIRIRPAYFEAHNNLGIAFLKAEQSDKAMICFLTALQLSPNLATAHNNIGNLLADKGQLIEAKGHYFKAIELKPDFADAYNNLGVLNYQENQIGNAVKNFQSAIRINPDFQNARINLKQVLTKPNNR